MVSLILSFCGMRQGTPQYMCAVVHASGYNPNMRSSPALLPGRGNPGRKEWLVEKATIFYVRITASSARTV
jgi:hypothetical protein